MAKEKEPTRNIYQRMLGAMAEVEAVQKKQARGVNYDFQSHGDVTMAVRTACVANGIFPQLTVKDHEILTPGEGSKTFMVKMWIHLSLVNVDVPSDRIEVEFPAVATEMREPAKALGSAWSYGLKYLQLKMFMVPDSSDEVDAKPDKKREDSPRFDGGGRQRLKTPYDAIDAYVASRGISAAEWKKFMLKRYKVEKHSQLNATQAAKLADELVARAQAPEPEPEMPPLSEMPRDGEMPEAQTENLPF